MVPFLATVGIGGAVHRPVRHGHRHHRRVSSRSPNQGSANLATVAPGIAEALGTTAVGLIAAVPAVMAYNYFARKIKILTAEMEGFSNDFLNIVKRHFLR